MTSLLTAGSTYVATLTYSGSALQLYVNGSIVYNPTSTSGSIGAPTNNTVIGIGTNPTGSAYASSNMFKGTIYSVHVFNKGLTDDEVSELYNSEVARGRS